MGKVDYESEIFLIQRYITLWKGTTASVDIISLSSKLFHDSCFKPAERRKYFFRYSVYVGENSFDLKQVAIISAETCQMVLNFILASICIEKNWGDENILVIPVTWQISAQPLAWRLENWKNTVSLHQLCCPVAVCTQTENSPWACVTVTSRSPVSAFYALDLENWRIHDSKLIIFYTVRKGLGQVQSKYVTLYHCHTLPFEHVDTFVQGDWSYLGPADEKSISICVATMYGS